MVFYNPFVKRESFSPRTLVTYQALSILSWALVVVFGIYYSIKTPDDVKHAHLIWRQAERFDTPFSQNIYLTGIFWILLWLSQVGYLWYFFSYNETLVNAAANVAPHFIINNLLVFAFIHLWVRNYFWPAEVILIVHFLTQTAAYWTHLGSPAFVHLPALAGPQAWVLTAIFWNGAVAVHAENLPARIVANVFIWVIFVIGHFHIFVGKDYLLGFSLSLLTLSLAVKQFAIKIIALQWIFAFVIFAVFLVGSLYVSGTVYTKRDILFRPIVEPEGTDREREPLLNA
ncbi:hypothetical protein VTN49DRAFT_121 [Thermomyces lanuginosus]|uniref:uncharacterized protein n=1 Tax=Thermomyces lanuginosus TaxID=5541 RepID=UPI003742C940